MLIKNFNSVEAVIGRPSVIHTTTKADARMHPLYLYIYASFTMGSLIRGAVTIR